MYYLLIFQYVHIFLNIISKKRLIKHEFEHTAGTARDKQQIAINSLEIRQNYFSNVTKKFLSNTHINLEIYNKVRRYCQKYSPMFLQVYAIFSAQRSF